MNKVSTGTRLASMFIDHAANTFIFMLTVMPFMIPVLQKAMNVTHEQNNFKMLSGNAGYLLLIPFCIYFLKDSLNGRSIAKRVMKLQVVQNSSNEVANPIRCFIRNIFCAIWPIEVIVTFFNPERRIGDFVAGTKVVSFDTTVQREEKKTSYIQIFIAFVTCYSILLAFYIPVNKMLEKTMENKTIPVIESSYNQELSREIEKMYSDSLGNVLKADVRAYEKIENDSLKYISVIFMLKENFLELESNQNELINKTTELLDTKCPKENYKGQLKYVYTDATSMQLTTQQYGN